MYTTGLLWLELEIQNHMHVSSYMWFFILQLFETKIANIVRNINTLFYQKVSKGHFSIQMLAAIWAWHCREVTVPESSGMII